MHSVCGSYIMVLAPFTREICSNTCVHHCPASDPRPLHDSKEVVSRPLFSTVLSSLTHPFYGFSTLFVSLAQTFTYSVQSTYSVLHFPAPLFHVEIPHCTFNNVESPLQARRVRCIQEASKCRKARNYTKKKATAESITILKPHPRIPVSQTQHTNASSDCSSFWSLYSSIAKNFPAQRSSAQPQNCCPHFSEQYPT